MASRARNLRFLLVLFLLTTDLSDCKFRHRKRRQFDGRQYSRKSNGYSNSTDDINFFQSNPPFVVDEDTLAPYTYLTIAEINLDTTSLVPKRFIEIHVDKNPSRTTPPFKNRLEGWRLLLIKGTTLEMVMSIDISAHTSDYSGTKLVIGDQGVPNAKIILQSAKTETCMDDCHVDLDSSPYAFILVVSMNEAIHDVFILPKVDGKYKPTSLLNDEVKQNMLFRNTWDIAVVGRKVPTNQCDFFTKLFPSSFRDSDFKYLLRDRDSLASSVQDYSLNYCCRDFKHYSPDCFKLGHPSPGMENDCTGKRFIMELALNSIQKSRMSAVFVDVNTPLCNADFPGVPLYRYAVVHDHDYAAAVARVMQSSESCPVVDPYKEFEKTAEDHQSSRLEIESIDESITEPIKFVEEFDLPSFQECQFEFTKPEDLLERPYKSWISVKPPDCRVTCRVCHAYFKHGCWPDKKNKFDLQQDGYHSDRRYLNKKIVNDHLLDEIHIEATHFFESLDSAESRQEQRNLEALQRRQEMIRLQPTMNEVSLAYIELRAGVSFRSHKLFMDGISKLNVNIGFKHRSEQALRKISKTLSTSFHTRLLRWLIRSNNFFSLICDGTTNRSVPYLVCLIQTLEENRPVVYLWGLLVITTGESGYNMVEDLKGRVAEDDEKVPGFRDFFKRRIVAFVSDSASNMVGISNSFYTHLKEYTEKDIALVKCGAHKLQRAILHAIDFPTDKPSSEVSERSRQRYFKSFSKINNQFYSFYMSRGSKRFQEFVELAEELELHAYRINYFFDVRWAASHKRCMETLYKNYDALYEDLHRITHDSSFKDDVESKAKELYKHLTDKTFPVVVAEFVDMLSVFQIMSERFQSKGGIMAGNVEIIINGYQDIQFLQSRPGSYLKNFLNKCSCQGVCITGSCSLEQYDECPQVKIGSGHMLESRKDGSHTIALSAFRNELYENLLTQLVKYFEPKTLEAFEIFNPKYLNSKCHGTTSAPLAESDLDSYYLEFQPIVPNSPKKSVMERFKQICTFYDLDGDEDGCAILAADWQRFVQGLTNDNSMMKLRNSDPATFWSAVLDSKSHEIVPAVKDLIVRVLSTSFTSADAERAFSMVSHIKTPDRSNLSPSTLENLVRIAFNGPETLSQESVFEYTKEFVKVASRVDDPTTIGGRNPRPEAYKRYFSRSRIF